MISKLLKSRHASKASVEHERLNSLINSMADGVIAVDAKMNVVISNGAALNILDVNDTLLGKRLSEVVRVVDKSDKPIDIEKMVSGTRTPTSSRDLLISYSDGSKINLYLSIAPVHLGYGKSGEHGFVLLMRDITHEKSLEEERDEFISVVSHELRTPIAISEGNISNAQFVAERTGDLKDIKLALDQAHEQILFLSGLVNDLATLSRAERGKLVLDVEPTNTFAMLSELVKAHTADAKKKHLKIRLDATATLPHLYSSELYVREILQNFITNALKYTEKGEVTIDAEPKDNGILFSVKDTGIGISKGDKERVFDKFFRSEDYRTRKTSGTGLGLYVTVKLARIIHAEITLKSKLNHGSTFSIFIPNLDPKTTPQSE